MREYILMQVWDLESFSWLKDMFYFQLHNLFIMFGNDYNRFYMLNA